MPYKDSASFDQWKKDNTVRISVNLMKNTDSDIIEWLAKQPSKQGAIKESLRSYIALQGDANPSET
jgi:hypothetical protein